MISSGYLPIMFFPFLCLQIIGRQLGGAWRCPAGELVSVRRVRGSPAPRGLAPAPAPAAVGLAAAGSGRPLSRRDMFYFHCPPQLEGECCRTETCKYKS